MLVLEDLLFSAIHVSPFCPFCNHSNATWTQHFSKFVFILKDINPSVQLALKWEQKPQFLCENRNSNICKSRIYILMLFIFLMRWIINLHLNCRTLCQKSLPTTALQNVISFNKRSSVYLEQKGTKMYSLKGLNICDCKRKLSKKGFGSLGWHHNLLRLFKCYLQGPLLIISSSLNCFF